MPDPQMNSEMPSIGSEGAERAQPRMLAPGYYSQECNAHKPCDQGGYCDEVVQNSFNT